MSLRYPQPRPLIRILFHGGGLTILTKRKKRCPLFHLGQLITQICHRTLCFDPLLWLLPPRWRGKRIVHVLRIMRIRSR